MVDDFTIKPIFSHPQRKGSHTWGYQVSQALESLISEGFFSYPNKRTQEHVVKALKSKGVLSEGEEDKISGFLARRVKKGVLKKSKISSTWVYWKE